MYKLVTFVLLLSCTGLGAQTLSSESQQSIENLKKELQTEFAHIISQANEQNIPLSALRYTISRPKHDSAYLGIIFEPHEDGLKILSIRPNSAAAIANLKVGMIITHINGLSVTSQSSKSTSELFSNRLRAVDSLILKFKEFDAPLTLDMMGAARNRPPYRLAISTNMPRSPVPPEMRKNLQTLTAGLINIITQRLVNIVEYETAKDDNVDMINFELADSVEESLSYQLTVGDYPDSPYRLPQHDYFADGRIPHLEPCGSEQCRKLFINYMAIRRSKESGALWQLRGAQFSAAGYGTEQRVRMAKEQFNMIAKFTDLPYANAMVGKLALEHSNEPISASVYLRRAVAGEQADPEALRLLSSIYANPDFGVIMPEEATRYQQLAEKYPLPTFSLPAEEFLARELALYPEFSSDFEKRYRPSTRPRNEVITLRGSAGIYPYLVLKDLPNCQTKLCQHHFKTHFILDRSTSNQVVSQMRLGEMYKAGYGVEQNLLRAISYFEDAARANIPYAQYQMAIIAFQLNEKIDYAKLMLERAANAGYRPAMVTLRFQYIRGEHREKDPIQADFWEKRYQAVNEVEKNVPQPSDEVSPSERIVGKLEHYLIDLDELFDAESRVLGSRASNYVDGRVFELPLTFNDAPPQ